MVMDRDARIENALGCRVVRSTPLHGGCIGEVARVELNDGTTAVAKFDPSSDPCLEIEGDMLTYLARHANIPVPQVFHSSSNLLIMQFIDGKSRFDSQAETHAGTLLGELHSLTSEQFGFERNTLIGGLRQINDWSPSWTEFFRERRLLYMAEESLRASRISDELFSRISRFADHLDEYIAEPEAPSLLHGDVWTTNVLAQHGKITGFLDPAIYFGHAEIELAFITMFNTFGRRFFDAYAEIRPLAPGFFEQRRDIYNLYPLLVHARLFGGGYTGSVENTLSRFGF